MSNRKVALVTGGARRVGKSIVQRLAQADYDVLFTFHRSATAAHELEQALAKQGGSAVALPADLTDPPAAVQAIAAAHAGCFNRLDVLVHSASLYEPGSLDSATLEQMRRFQAIHVESPLLLCRHFADSLRRSHGQVVMMVDVLAERPWPEYLAYCASKAALVNLTLGLARELAPEATVNGVAPGVVEWPENYPQQEQEKYLRRVPLARAGTPQDVAELVHFLCTGGQYITGQILRLDGGRSIT